MCCCILPRLRYAQLLNVAGVIVVYFVTFCLLLPVILQGWPYSPYYNGTWNNMDDVRRVVLVCLLLPLCCISLYNF